MPPKYIFIKKNTLVMNVPYDYTGPSGELIVPMISIVTKILDAHKETS